MPRGSVPGIAGDHPPAADHPTGRSVIGEAVGVVTAAPAQVLAALAELAPASRGRRWDVTGREPVWLTKPRWASRREADRLAALDVLHRDERLLRCGWGFLLGTGEVEGANRNIRLPLLTEPVRLEESLRGYRIVSAGDLELTPLVEDAELAAALEAEASTAMAEQGMSSTEWMAAASDSWLHRVAAAVGLPATRVVMTIRDYRAGRGPGVDVCGVAAAGLYVVRDVFSGSQRDSLLNWAGQEGLASTALAAVYGDGNDHESAPRNHAQPDTASEPADGGPADPVWSPLPLNAAQREVVRRARRESVAVVSGPPGSGKSHAVVAAALDVVYRGGSVLVATQSTHAADVLGELLDRYPGPTPVLFGDAERRDAIAAELAKGMGAGYDERTLRADARAVTAAAARVRRVATAIDAMLALEQRAAELPQWEPLLAGLRAEVPGAFSPTVDLTAAEVLADQLESDMDEVGVGDRSPGGRLGSWQLGRWWRRRRWRSAHRRLRVQLGAGPTVPLDQLRAALEAGRASRAAARLATTGGTDLEASWRALSEAEAVLAAAVGTAMRHQAGSVRRWNRRARRSAGVLAGALRAGRNRRRQLLARLDGPALVRALPLWIGTAADAEDLLPPAPGLFDLVILDEASHLDQLRAAPVLARARRALVVGDPRQLRFVSFIPDGDVTATLHRYGLDDRVDVRRTSAFDLAAGAAPVTWLDEHYRSVPHLIQFSADRFYTGRLSVATRHPRNDSLGVIEVVRVRGAVSDGVNVAEVKEAVAAVERLNAAGVTGIGVITPFRAQADALEAALVETFPVAELSRLGLRVGTVHAFQGSEAHTVVASLGLSAVDSPARNRFVSDSLLFNVLITRARQRMVVVTSLDDCDGLIGDYLAFSEEGPPELAALAPAAGWAAALAGELRRAGLRVRGDYPVGRWTVDLCVGGGAGAVGLICRVHPAGVVTHRQRQRALSRAGWRLVDAYASRWAGDPVRAAVELSSALV